MSNFHDRTTLPRDRKVEGDLEKHIKKSRHIPKNRYIQKESMIILGLGY